MCGKKVMIVATTLAAVMMLGGVGMGQSKPKGTMYLSSVRADLKTVDAAAVKAIAEYDAAKAAGKDTSNSAAALAEVVFNLADHVDRSLVIDGQPGDEPSLAQATEKLKSLTAELDKWGIWTCYRPGEAPLVAKVFGQWKNYRQVLDEAVGKARRDKSAEAVAAAEAELAKHSTAGDEGKGFAGLSKHPAFTRAQAELGRVKGQAPAAKAGVEPAKAIDKPPVANAADQPPPVKVEDKPVVAAAPKPAADTPKPAADAPPADLKKGRGSGNLATVGDVVRRVKKGAAPDADLFRTLLGGYEGSIIDGWDERTPDLLAAKDLIAAWYPKFEKELNTCFRPDEPLLAVDGAPVPLRSRMDKLLAEANKTLTWAKNPVNTKGGAASAIKTIGEECETPLVAAIKKCQDAAKPADAEKHPTCARATAEMARIKAELQSLAGGVAGAEAGAEAAGKQALALDATLNGRNPQHEGLVPADCRELFEILVTMVEDKDVDRHCRGIPQDQLARWVGLTPRMEKEVLPQIEKFIKDMHQRYGDDEAAFKAKMEAYRNDAKQHDIGAAYMSDAWPKLVKLEQAIKNLPPVKETAIKVIMDFSQKKYEGALKTSTENPDYNTKMKEQNFLELVPNVRVVVDVDPANAKAKELLDAILKGAGGVKAAEEKAIDAADWVGRTTKFSGPGNADELEKNIFEFAKSGGWVGSKTNPYTVLAVAITGEWYSHKKNLLGDTIQWGLPVRVATKRTSDKGNDVVAVWFLSILTQEGASVQKAPPWNMFAVGDSYRMRQAKFDKQVKK